MLGRCQEVLENQQRKRVPQNSLRVKLKRAIDSYSDFIEVFIKSSVHQIAKMNIQVLGQNSRSCLDFCYFFLPYFNPTHKSEGQ